MNFCTLQDKASQVGVTEIYLQINSSGATYGGFLKMLPELKYAYPELDNIGVRIFGPSGRTWYNGVFQFREVRP